MNAALLLCAGSGNRMRGTVEDKVLHPLAGKPVFCHSLEAIKASGAVEQIVVLYRDPEQRLKLEAAAGDSAAGINWVPGGAERSDSVHAGLDSLPSTTEVVLIHDAARPLLPPSLVLRLLEAARNHGGAVAAHRVTETIKRAPSPASPNEPTRLEDLERDRLWAMETPQVFRYRAILDAYRNASRRGIPMTDDVAAFDAAGLPVLLVENPDPNPKITCPEDLALCELLLQYPPFSNLQ